MRDAHIRISRIELERVTRLTISGETDPLIEPAVRLKLVAIIAIELLSIHRRDVGSEMALMIETKRVGIARVDALELKFGMRFRKRSERIGKSLLRPRQLEDDLLRGMRMSMKRIARNAHSFLCRRRHQRGIVVAGRALRAGDQSEIIQAAMFLVARRAGLVLHHVRFVKTVLLMAGLAFAIDRFNGDAVAKTIAQHCAKFSGGDIAIVAFRAVVGELRVARRNLSGVEKSFAVATWEKKNREQSAEDRQ